MHFRTIVNEMWKKLKNQNNQYFGTLVAEMWKEQKTGKWENNNNENKKDNDISGLLVVSTFHLQESQNIFFVFLVCLVFLVFSTFYPQNSQNSVFVLVVWFFGIFHILPKRIPKYHFLC